MVLFVATIEERITAENKKTYRVKIRLRGKPVQSATFDRITDAKKWAASTESAIREGRYFKTAESKKHTFAEMVERYIKTILPLKPKSQAKQTMQLNWWKSNLGDYTLSDVTPALITEFKDKLFAETYGKKNDKKRTPATVVRYMAALSHCFTVAVNDWGWLDDSPMRKVSKPKEPRGRVRYLSDLEREALLEACKNSKNKMLYTIVVMAISTGLRLNELLYLTWDDIDLKKGIALIHETKNGERRSIPIKGLCLELLKPLQRSKPANKKYIFSKPDNFAEIPMNIRSFWLKALKDAQIENFRFHDLRHCTASYLAMNGASLAEIAEVLGHKTLQMVKRYAHLSEAHTATVVEKMNHKIFG